MYPLLDPVYGDGVFLISESEAEGEPIADIVFVHGIRGSAFHTWRTGEEGLPWHKEWIAKDFPNFRVLSVEYDSHLT